MSNLNNAVTRGTLTEKEYHPAASSAMQWVKEYLKSDIERTFRIKESFASTAIEGNRLAEICLETLNRILTGEPVSDRYLLGLAWTLKAMEEIKHEFKN